MFQGPLSNTFHRFPRIQDLAWPCCAPHCAWGRLRLSHRHWWLLDSAGHKDPGSTSSTVMGDFSPLLPGVPTNSASVLKQGGVEATLLSLLSPRSTPVGLEATLFGAGVYWGLYSGAPDH